MALFPVGCMQCKYAQYILSRALSFFPPPPPLAGPRVGRWQGKTGDPFSEFSIPGCLVNLRNMPITASDARINQFFAF